jgi:acetyltransferase-like isoleucine patch superfamily enzyme
MGPNCSLAALEVLTSAIGSNCLIASDTLFMTSDMHSILDRTTRVRLNPAQDIFVDDNVWIAYQAKILKGAHIGKGSIIGLGSIVTTKIPPHTLAAGQPAKVIKEDVAWDFSLR